MKRTNEEIIESIAEIMLSNNFTHHHVDFFRKDADFERDFFPEKYRKWLFRQERYYSKHYYIGGHVFKICKKPADCDSLIIRRYSDIFDAYNRPSIYKVRIWQSWVEDLLIYVYDMYVTSRNTFHFSIGGEIQLPTTGEIVPFYITHTRQEIYL